MTPGDIILEEIVKGNLFHVECPSDPSHVCLVIWSSGAAEQLEAIAMKACDVRQELPHDGPESH